MVYQPPTVERICGTCKFSEFGVKVRESDEWWKWGERNGETVCANAVNISLNPKCENGLVWRTLILQQSDMGKVYRAYAIKLKFAQINIEKQWTLQNWKLHCVSKKFPPLKLSATLSNFNWFSKFLHCWKAHEICYTKPIQYYPSYIRHVATLLWETKNSNFWPSVNCASFPQPFQQLINTMLCLAFFGKFVYQPLCCAFLQRQTLFLSKSCPRSWMSRWLLTNTAVTSAVTNFQSHRLIAKQTSKRTQWHRKFYLQSVREKTRYLRHVKYQNLWMNNKVRSDKNAICLHFSISADYLQKIWIFNFPR